MRTDPGGVVDYLAQDEAGNVWWLGHDGAADTGSWRAGEGGARAGLAMSATPRRGDGYPTAYLPGEGEHLATVIDAPDEPGGGAGTVVVETDDRADTYRRGAGLIERVEGSIRWSLRPVAD
ncbi:hypothetical protein [Nocardioides sp.]|uniref:hypothetical protein n=1 Tax=Nocardioides sp. TaxID=35761 RepID=UPI0039E2DA45